MILLTNLALVTVASCIARLGFMILRGHADEEGIGWCYNARHNRIEPIRAWRPRP